MTFFSHSKKIENAQSVGSKTIANHIQGVLEKAKNNYSEITDFDIDSEILKELLTIIVSFHDLGKYTSYFQNYLLNIGKIDNDNKRHPPIGAFVAYNYFIGKNEKLVIGKNEKLVIGKNEKLVIGKNEKLALIALITIFLHHRNLADISAFSEKLNYHVERIFENQKLDIEKNLPHIEKELNISEISKFMLYPDVSKIRCGFKIWSKGNPSIQDYFLVNYFFSLLLEADKLDASDTKLYQLKKISDNLVDERFGYPNSEVGANLSILSNNDLRNFCRAEVSSNILDETILDNYLFTLTAPTGIGKTMTALDFALKLKSKIRSELSIESRIIYALPFINIIEQALSEYEKTLPENAEILGHYQYADVFGEENNVYNSEQVETKNYNQKLMSVDTWQADVVITSFVQFFETLIGNRNKLLKKFNHFANSIIILDEVQTLRLDQMPLIGATLFYLSKFLKARIILMTATKPKIFDLAQEHLLNNENEKIETKELLKSYKSVFSVFKRTKIVSLLSFKLNLDEISYDFIETVFSKNWDNSKSCLIVCNTVNRSIEIHNAIKNFIEENGFPNEVEYLSTNILPAHRFKRIEKIKALIGQQKAPVLISTQVVEAGVDLDFDMGFRDVGPIDSIIQVAGRINRNNNQNKLNSPLYIVDFKDSEKIYGSLTTNQAKSALSSKEEFLESEYLSLITQYFDNISDRSSFDKYNKVFDSMKALRYDSEDKEIMPVSSFKIIEESKTTSSVFVELSNEETLLREKYLAKIRNEIPKEEFDKHYKQAFQQRIITVPNYLTKDLRPINDYEDNILVVPIEQLSIYYKDSTGFIRKKQSTATHFL